jgi:hypothetical protein
MDHADLVALWGQLGGNGPLDAEQCFVALERGCATVFDFVSADWDPWSVVARDLDSVREKYGIGPGAQLRRPHGDPGVGERFVRRPVDRRKSSRRSGRRSRERAFLLAFAAHPAGTGHPLAAHAAPRHRATPLGDSARPLIGRAARFIGKSMVFNRAPRRHLAIHGPGTSARAAVDSGNGPHLAHSPGRAPDRLRTAAIP